MTTQTISQSLSTPTEPKWRQTLSNALIITRREVRDSFRDWRIITPIIILTFGFPFVAQFLAGKFLGFVSDYGAQIVGERTIPFLLMIVGFFGTAYGPVLIPAAAVVALVARRRGRTRLWLCWTLIVLAVLAAAVGYAWALDAVELP